MIVPHAFPPSLSKLVSVWLTISLLFVSGQAVYSYGALAGFIIIGSFLAAFVLLISFLWMSRRKLMKNSRLLTLLRAILFLESVTIHLLILFLTLNASLRYSSYLILFVLTVFLLVLIVLFRNKADRLHTVKIAILLGLAVFLPNYIFLQKGLETVYHNLLHYHPRFLHVEQEGAILLFFLLTATFFSKMFSQLPWLDRYVEVNFSKGIQKLFFGTLIWATIILAFSSMTLVSFTHAKPLHHENELLFMMLGQQVERGFLIIVYLSLFTSTIIELSGAIRKLAPEHSFLKLGLAATAIILTGVSYQSGISIITLFISFGFISSIICLIYLIRMFLHHLNIKTGKVDIN